MTDPSRTVYPRSGRASGRRPVLLALALALLVPTAGRAQKAPLDHEAYDLWNTIAGERISPDGAWVLYQLRPRVGDADLVIAQPIGPEHRAERAGDGRFTADSRFALFTISPAHDSVRALKRKETKRAEMPTDTLGILDLASGEVVRIGDVRSWQVPEEGGALVAYLLDSEPADSVVADSAVAQEPRPEPTPEVVPEPEPEPAPEPAPEPGLEPEPGEEEGEEDAGEREKPDGYTLVLRDLVTGREHRYEGVSEYALSKNGRMLAYATVTEDGAGDGAHVVDPSTGESRPVLMGEGVYSGLALSEDGRRVAFLTDRDDFAAEQPARTLYAWESGDDEAERVAAEGVEGIPSGWWVSEHGELEFSRSGRRLYFGTAPRPAPEPEDTLLADEEVTLDVWNWRDDLLQPMQLVNVDEERKRSYRAVAHLDRRGRVVQLATPEMPSVRLARHGDGDVALAETNVPYRHLIGIEAPGFSDIWLVDVRDGDRQRVVENRQVEWAQPSPDGRYAAWYDYGEAQWQAVSMGGGSPVTVSRDVPFPLWDESDDHPMPASAYGMAGWTTDDRELLVYDRYDVWALDPEGRRPARRVTDGYGREHELRLRRVDLDPDEPAIDPDAPLLLSAFHTVTKEAGFFRDRVRGTGVPRPLLLEPKRFGRPVRAEGTDRVLYTREDVGEFPDLWVASTSFESPRKVSEANPQQSRYTWATVELIEWISTEGVPLQGLLYRPEDFDPAERYPMMVTFYERDSDNLHEHHPPLPHRSVIRPTFYASRGYVVFVPDIVYEDGYPGESAMNAVMPGVLKLAAEPWVDEDNVGIQGHSWGGYQIAHMVTRTNFFRAAGAGAPVANMTSAYGGIRWGTGMSRVFQYERTQSRIGATLWDAPMRYLENSPLFFLDAVETPVLIMHNDGDTAVPWYQGIELFVALRRLGKPAWLINYNDQPHWPVTAANIRDWNIRMQQFFDHLLKGAPAPVWMAEGIPATEKGRTLGLELVEEPDPPRATVAEESDPGR